MLTQACAVILLALLAPAARAQSYSLRLHAADGSDSALLLRLAKPPAAFSGPTDIPDYLRALIPALQEEGFLTASLDSLAATGNRYDAFVYTGAPYSWARLSAGGLPPALMAGAGITPGQYDGQKLSPKRLSQLSEKILGWCENNGYPFARLWLDSLAMDESGGVKAALALDRGALRHIDSITLEGTGSIAPAYLSRYLDLYIGDVYSEAKLRTLGTRIRELPFLQESRPWSVAFTPFDTRLKLFLKEKKSNQLNALIGLIPDNRETGKFLLTADLLASLQNALSHGESIGFSYQNLQARSPRLKADLVWPYLFDTPFGAEGHFDLFKRDSAFRRTTFQLGTRYQINATDYLRVYYENNSNRVISVDTQYIRINKKLPQNVDVNASGGGAELLLSRTDYRLNPRHGYSVRIGATALARTVGRTDAIEDIRDGSGFDYSTLYDSLDQKRYQARVSADAAYYFPLAKRLTLRAGYAGGWVSGSNLFQNELYQIGGFRLLRGFDEQSIFANHYHMASLELRLLMAGNSNFYLFSDNAWVQSRYAGSRKDGLFNGFGIGASLETKTGLFTISLGLGRTAEVPLQLRQSKIHFGYAAFF